MIQSGNSPTVRPVSFLRFAAWLGLLTGLVEVFIQAARKYLFREILFVAPDSGWMIPVADLIFFTAVGLAYLIPNRFWPRLFPMRAGVVLLAFLACFGVLFIFSPRLHKYAAMLLAAGIAVQVYERLAAAGPRFDPIRRRSFQAMLAVLAGLALGIPARRKLAERAAVRKLPQPSSAAPNVLLIVMDTVRSPSLRLHGYHRPTSRDLERWSSSGVWFDRAVATAPWTLPSHASMFTGRFPHELSADWLVPLDATHPTLAEFYTANGYRTGGFVSNTGYCSAEFGLNRGFDHYEDYAISAGQVVADASLGRYVTSSRRLRRLVGNYQILGRKSAADVTSGFLQWLEAIQERPFFAFVNYYDAHAPYIPPPPFDRMFGQSPPVESSPWARRENVPSDKVRAMIDNYDASITYIDTQLGVLFDALSERDLRDNTLVVITSDHGEEFGEHGLFDHGNTLYLPSLHVPLVMSFPDRIAAGTRVSSPVSLRDLASTLVDFSHRSAGQRFPGSSLSRTWSGAAANSPSDEPILCEVRAAPNVPSWLPVQRGDMYALARGNWRYIRNGDGREELYDLERDPGEAHDLSTRADNGRVLIGMRVSLAEMLAS